MSVPVKFMPPTELRRLAAMCERLGSDQAGEVIAAAALITQAMRRLRVTWADILHAEPAAGVVPGRLWSDCASDLLADRNGDLTTWEAKFCSDILDKRISRGFEDLTEKQGVALGRIADRLGVPKW